MLNLSKAVIYLFHLFTYLLLLLDSSTGTARHYGKGVYEKQINLLTTIKSTIMLQGGTHGSRANNVLSRNSGSARLVNIRKLWTPPSKENKTKQKKKPVIHETNRKLCHVLFTQAY